MGQQTPYTTPSTAFSVVVSDFNGDGKADLASPIVNSNSVVVYLGDGQGGFGSLTSFKTGPGPAG